MQLNNEQIALVRGIKRSRKTRKYTFILATISIVPLLLMLWMQLAPQIEQLDLSMGLGILFALWFKAFLYPSVTNTRVEDLLFDYINNDAESMQQLVEYKLS